MLNYVTQIGSGNSMDLRRPEIRYYLGIIDTEEINALASPRDYILSPVEHIK